MNPFSVNMLSQNENDFFTMLSQHVGTIPQLNQQTRGSAGCPQPANISQSLNPSPTTLGRDPLATQINSLQLPSNFTAANNTVNAASLALPVVSTTAPPALNVNVNTGNMGNGTMGSMVHPANLAAMLQTNMAAHLPPQFAAALPMMPPHILQALAQAAATMPQPPTLPAPPARKTKQSSKFRSFEDARAYVRTLGLKSNEKWREWSKSGKRPHDIPSHPDVTYASSGWISYPDFLGYADSKVTGTYKRNAAAAGLWALQNDADNDEKGEQDEDDGDEDARGRKQAKRPRGG